jgi:STE24 endopeptidase
MQIMNLGNLLLMAVMVWLTVKIPEMHTAFGFEGINYGFAYVLVGFGLGLITPLTGIATNAYSRKAEYRADRQAVLEGYGGALITALKKLGKENFTHLAPAGLLVVLEYSHPPLAQRIEAIEQTMKEK